MAKRRKPEFTEVRTCEHCGNKAPFEKLLQHSGVESHFDEKIGHYDAGPVYELMRCPACNDVVLRQFDYHDFFEPDDSSYSVLYPSSKSAPKGLPRPVERAYVAASRVAAIEPNAYAVLLGRVLDVLCVDRGASGDSLAARLADLAAKHEIPEKLVNVAQGLRQLRNVGAHADLGELTASEVPVLEGLTRAILEYVYTAPWLARAAERRLEQLKTKPPTKRR